MTRTASAIVVLMLVGIARAEPLTLPATIEGALIANEVLAVKRDVVDRARAELRSARLLLPDDAVVTVDMASDSPFADEGERSTGVTLSQALPLPGRRARVSAAEARFAAAELDYRAARLDLIRATRVAFHELDAADRRLALARQTLSINEEIAGAAEARLDAGEISTLELELAAIDVETTRAAVAASELARRQAATALAALLGEPGGADALQTDAPEPTEHPGVLDPEALVDVALRSRPDLEALTQRVLAAAGEQRAARLWYLPRAELSLGVERARGLLSGDAISGSPDIRAGILSIEDEDELVTLSLGLRLPTSGRGRADLALRAAELRIAQRERDALAIAIESEVRAAATTVGHAARIATMFREILPRVDASLALLRSAYEEGQVSLAEYLVQRDRGIQARRSLVDHELSLVVALADLDRALGRSEVGEDSE